MLSSMALIAAVLSLQTVAPLSMISVSSSDSTYLGIQLRLDVSHDNGGVWSMSLVLQVVATTLLATTLLRLAAGAIPFLIAVVLASSFAVVHIV